MGTILGRGASRQPDDSGDGFTLIELLVVILIIGILAAVAIPLFLHQRQKGFDAQAKSDLRNLANFEELYLADFGQYGSLAQVRANEPETFVTHGITLTVVRYDGESGYCLEAQSAGSPRIWLYDSEAGGLQPQGTLLCPRTTTGLFGGSLSG